MGATGIIAITNSVSLSLSLSLSHTHTHAHTHTYTHSEYALYRTRIRSKILPPDCKYQDPNVNDFEIIRPIDNLGNPNVRLLYSPGYLLNRRYVGPSMVLLCLSVINVPTWLCSSNIAMSCVCLKIIADTHG